MTETEIPDDETVRVTISMPQSMLRAFDAEVKKQRPRSNRSRHIQTLITRDMETAKMLRQPAKSR